MTKESYATGYTTTLPNARFYSRTGPALWARHDAAAGGTGGFASLYLIAPSFNAILGGRVVSFAYVSSCSSCRLYHPGIITTAARGRNGADYSQDGRACAEIHVEHDVTVL
jgi:hypothetical protein